MSDSNVTAEDRLDRVYRTVALVMLAIGSVDLLRAIALVGKHSDAFTHVAALTRSALILAALALCLFTLVRCVSYKRACQGRSLLVRNGFVFQQIQKSAVRAAFVTYFALVMMNGHADDSSLPGRFYLHLALAIITLTFGISYLISSHVAGGQD